MKIYHLFIVRYVFQWGLVALLWVLSVSIAHAGAWNLAPGDGQIISTYDYSEASSTFSDVEDDDNMLSFSKNEGRIFIEHGLTKDWTFVGNGAHQTIQLSGTGSDINFSDFADIELGLRYQIARKDNYAVALQGSYIIGGGPPSSILDINGPGDSVELRGFVGQSKALKKVSLFYEAQLAIRSENFDDIEEWHSELSLGIKAAKKYTVIGQFFHSDIAAFGRDGFFVPSQQITKLKASFVYEYKPNRLVQIGVQETVQGRNTIRERGLTLGTWLRY